MPVIIFILILSFLVLIHELGHMLAAKKSGVKVEEFGFGYPPKLLKLFKDKSGTEYTFNLLPFGGFVRLSGEDAQEESITAKLTGQEFFQKSKLTRFTIIMAGALTNFIFGVLAFGAIYTKIGIPEAIGAIKIEEVAPDSPAFEAGIIPGDKIISVHGEGFNQETTTYDDFIQALSQHQGEEVLFTFSPETSKYDAAVYVRKPEEIPADQGAVGITIKDTEFVFYPFWQMPFRGMWVGLKAAITFGIFILGSLGTMFKDLFFSGVVPEDVTGPIGIGHQVAKQNLLTPDLISITNFNFAAVLSINLAMINILPFPALDGGRAFLILIEAIIKKRLKPKVERWINVAGMVVLLSLIIAITFRDLKVINVDTGFFSNLINPIGKFFQNRFNHPRPFWKFNF